MASSAMLIAKVRNDGDGGSERSFYFWSKEDGGAIVAAEAGRKRAADQELAKHFQDMEKVRREFEDAQKKEEDARATLAKADAQFRRIREKQRKLEALGETIKQKKIKALIAINTVVVEYKKSLERESAQARGQPRERGKVMAQVLHDILPPEASIDDEDRHLFEDSLKLLERAEEEESPTQKRKIEEQASAVPFEKLGSSLTEVKLDSRPPPGERIQFRHSSSKYGTVVAWKDVKGVTVLNDDGAVEEITWCSQKYKALDVHLGNVSEEIAHILKKNSTMNAEQMTAELSQGYKMSSARGSFTEVRSNRAKGPRHCTP